MENEDQEFFDELYKQWAATTGAKDTFWMPEEDESFPGCFNLYSVNPNITDVRTPVASFLTDRDAEFIAGLHGALPDLIRALHDALGEAEAKDTRRDESEGYLADALLENIELRSQLHDMEIAYDELSSSFDALIEINEGYQE